LVNIYDHLNLDLVIEQDRPQIFYKTRSLAATDAIIPRIGASVTFYGAAVIQQFEMMGVKTPTSAAGLLKSRDKLRSFQFLSRSGVGLPKTVFSNHAKNVKNVISSVGGVPLIVKLLEGTQGLGVVLVEHMSAAKSVIEAFNTIQARFLVQEYIEESRGTDIRAIVVGGKVIASMVRKGNPDEFRSNLHRGGKGTNYALSAAEGETALKAAKALDLDFCGVDILQSNRGPLVLEVNASPGLEGIERATGVNVAAEVIKFLEQKK
jgi:ribosomal protein S6--L-glutamate ligase